jgi:hypothetical protein
VVRPTCRTGLWSQQDNQRSSKQHRKLLPGLLRHSEHLRDVIRIRDAHDHGRMPVDAAHEDRARRVIVGVSGRDHWTGDVRPKLWDGEGGALPRG